MSKFFFFLVSCFCSVASLAAGIAGYEAGGRQGDGKPPTIFTCQTASNGVVLTVENLVLVRIEREGSLPGGKTDKNHAGSDVSVLRYEENPSVLNGGKVYAMPLGKDWAGKGPNIEGLDLSRSIGSTSVTGNKASIQIRIKEGAEWQPMTLVFEGSSGRAWLGVIGEGFQAKNKSGNPLLLIGSQCQQPTAEALSAMASRL